VAAGGDELGDGVGERAPRVNVEDRVRVFAVGDAALRQDHADEVHARQLEEGKGRVLGEQPHVHVRDVADHVVPAVQHRQRCDALVVHQLQRRRQRLVAVDREHRLVAHVQVAQGARVQALDAREVPSVFPEKADQP